VPVLKQIKKVLTPFAEIEFTAVNILKHPPL